MTSSRLPCIVWGMRLKVQTVVVYYVDWTDLEDFIAEVYGVRPEIAAMEECGNDVTLNYNIDGDFDSYDETRFNEFKKTGYVAYGTRMLLNKLAKEGYAPFGEYNIKISW